MARTHQAADLPKAEAEAYRRRVDLRVLGTMEVSVDGEPVALGGPKQRAVLAHLLVRANRVVSVDDLIDEIWGESPPPTARKTLQVYVTHLRRALGAQRLEWRAPGYILHVEPDEMDVSRFESLVRQAEQADRSPDRASALYREALALWSGRAYADIAAEGSVSNEVTRLDELRLQAVEGRVAADLASNGRGAELVSELQVLTDQYPLRERLWASLMLAIYRAGRQADALAAYQRARAVLANELGVDPSEDLQRLHESILQHDPSLEGRFERLRGYTLLEEIGEGSFGVVYRGTQPLLSRDVAIKVIRPELANDAEFIRRFETEAQLVARLEHPSIVPLYDYWREPDSAYLVMRWMRGGSLEDALDGPRLDLGRIARLEGQIANALAFAHELDIVHRDIKPANVLLDEDGNAYLSDFGIAADLARIQAGHDEVRASSEHLSPEQIRGETITASSDIYALGLLCYRMLCGEFPFAGSTPAVLRQQQLLEPLPPVTAARPELPAALDDVIRRATAKDATERFANALAFDEAFRSALRADATAAVRVGERSNPYKGLRSFSEADASDFFGREAMVDGLVARLSEQVAGGRFLGVVGPSGSGKSSVVRAGLIPALRAGAVEGSETWFIVGMMPGSHPFEELESALLAIATNTPATLLDELEGDDHGLVRAVERILPPDGSELFLLIDQFEELFTHVDEEEQRARFLASLLTSATDPSSRVRVLITLRADSYDRPLAYPGFDRLLGRRTETVTSMTPAELRRAIIGPAERTALEVEPVLVTQIVADATERRGVLPMLQYTLTELYERQRDGSLTLADYRDIGGVGGALAGRAEHLYSTSGDEGREATRQLFLRLVVVDEQAEDLRRRVRGSELLGIEGDRDAMEATIDAFTRHRLLTADRDPVTRGPTVEVAHEALLRSWPRLRGWIDAAREDLRNQRALAAETSAWVNAGRDDSFLVRGSRLERLESWSMASSVALDAGEREFLDESLRARDVERAAETARQDRERLLEMRSRKRLRTLVAILTVGTLVAGGLALVAQDRNRRAERESRIAMARELAASAVANLEVDAERSVLLALEAVETTYRVDGSALPEAEEALHRALQADRLIFSVPGSLGDFSADGSRLNVAALEPGRADVYDAATGALISRVTGADTRSQIGPDGELGLVFSGDGDLFATWSTNGYTEDIRLFRTASGEEVRRLSVPSGALYDPTFSPDGRYVATGGPVGGCCHETYLFGLRTGELLNIQALIGPIAFSSDGDRLLVADSWFDDSLDAWAAGYIDDSQQRVRDVPHHAADIPTYRLPGQESPVPIYDGVVRYERLRGIALFPGHTGDVNDAAWSPSGDQVATSSPEEVNVWHVSRIGPYDINDPDNRISPWFTASPPAGLFAAVAFGPDSRIATGMSNGTTIVWRLSADGLDPTITLAGHDAAVTEIDFSPDGTRLTTSSGDGNVKVWDITSVGAGKEWLTLPGAGGLAYSPDGSSLAVGSEDGDLRLYDAQTGTLTRTLSGHRGRVNAIAFDASGSMLASAGFADGTARVWDATSGTELAQIDPAGPPDDRCRLYPTSLKQVFDVAFSRDGNLLATGGWKLSPTALSPTEGGKRGSWSTITWDPPTGVPLSVLDQDLDEQEPWGRSVDFSPDGELVAGADWDFVSLWATDDGRIVARIKERQVDALAFSPDGRLLATGSLAGDVKLWEARTGREVDVLTGNLGQVQDLVFSPDGTQLATSSSDGTLRLWDVTSGQQIMTLARGVAAQVGAKSKFCFRTNAKRADAGVGGKLAFSPDGTRLAYSSADGTVRVLALDIDDLIAIARSRLTRSWTTAECRIYLHLEPCP